MLLVSRDASLKSEVEGALGELPEDMRLALHTELDERRGIEHAVHRSPDLVLLELRDDPEEVRRAAAEITRASSDPLVIVVYRPNVAGGEGRSEALLIELMRAGVRDFLRRPLSTGELEDLLRRHVTSAGREQSTRGQVLSFVGNKGGVGKSTLSVSVACGLARKAPGRVLLIDASLQQGSLCELLGVTPEATISDAARQEARLDERLLRMLSASHESGLRVLAAPTNAIDAAPIDDQAFARILAVARRAFDYVIVDTFPLIDSVTVAILDVSDLVFVVLNDLVPTVLGTAELLKVLARIGVSEERIRVVLNHPNQPYRGRLSGVDVAQRLGQDLDFVVPYDKRVLASTNTGSPHALRASRWRGFGRSLREIETSILSRRAEVPADAAEDSPRADEGAEEPRLEATNEW